MPDLNQVNKMQRVKKAFTLSYDLIYFAFIGFLTNLSGYCLFLLMTWIGIGYKLSMTCLYFFCAGLSYSGNKRLTFSHRSGNRASCLRFLFVYLLSYLLNLFALIFFVDYLGLSYYKIEALAIIVIAGFMFISLKLFVFLEKDSYSQ